MERVKSYYVDKNVRGIGAEVEFIDLVHDFEVYIRDSEMFEPSKRGADIALNESGEVVSAEE
jgi:hypothetical protein